MLDKSIPQIFVDDSWRVVGKEFIRLLRSHLPEDSIDQAPHDAIVNFALIVVVEPTFVPDWNRRIVVTGGSNRNWNEPQFFGRLLFLMVFFVSPAICFPPLREHELKRFHQSFLPPTWSARKRISPFEVQ